MPLLVRVKVESRSGSPTKTVLSSGMASLPIMSQAALRSIIYPSIDSISRPDSRRSEEHTSELQSLMSISYAVFCLKTNKKPTENKQTKKVLHNKYIHYNKY